MGKKEIISHVMKSAGLEKSEAEKALIAVTDAIKQSVVDGEAVVLKGFGTFCALVCKAKKGRDLHSGKEIDIPERIKPTFKACKEFKAMCNKD